MNLKTAGASLALIGALGGGAAVANAATSAPSPSAPTSSSASATTHQGVNPMKSDLDKLVKAGTITSAQETKILAGLQNGHGRPDQNGPRGGFAQHGERPGNGDKGREGGQKSLAAALKLSESQLRADFAKGETLAQIASEQKVSQADVTKALQKDADARVSDMVTKMWNTKMGQRPTSAPSGSSTSAAA